MKTSKTWYLLWFYLWIQIVHANVDDSQLSFITLQPDGSLPMDGSQCVPVGTDGKARVVFTMPSEKTTPDDIGMDYGQQGLYFSLLSAENGSFEPETTYISRETSLYREVRSPVSTDKIICFIVKEDKIVPSSFEVGARYFGELGALRVLEYIYGGAYNNFLKAIYTGAVPTFTVLHNHIEMGNDMRQIMELQGGMSSTASGFASAAVLSGGFLAFPQAWRILPATLTDMGTVGSFYLFYSAPVTNGLIDGIDSGLVTPYIGEKISPANGTERQPGSILASQFFRGPFMLSALYEGQNYWNVPGGTGVAPKNEIPNIMVSLTIVTTGEVRQFVRSVSQHFLSDGSILEFIEDGLLMISVATVDNPSNVISIYFDENLKGRTSELLGSYQHHSASLKAMDDSINLVLNAMENTLYYGILLSVAFATLPYAAPYVASALQSAKVMLTGAVPVFLIGWMEKAKKSKPRITAGMAKVGNVVAKVPGASRITSRAVGAGIPLDSVKSTGNAMAISVVFNMVGPGFRTLTRFLSNMLRDVSVPGSALHKTFRNNRQIVIGHYVMP